uniref:FunD7 n=1 Tax=Streptosporangium sp. KD35 TaxID=2162663 RepID=A0A2U9KD24_9ACTN|nr:FunD7 [Streptosporangium sp. KD35]
MWWGGCALRRGDAVEDAHRVGARGDDELAGEGVGATRRHVDVEPAHHPVARGVDVEGAGRRAVDETEDLRVGPGHADVRLGRDVDRRLTRHHDAGTRDHTGLAGRVVVHRVTGPHAEWSRAGVAQLRRDRGEVVPPLQRVRRRRRQTGEALDRPGYPDDGLVAGRLDDLDVGRHHRPDVPRATAGRLGRRDVGQVDPVELVGHAADGDVDRLAAGATGELRVVVGVGDRHRELVVLEHDVAVARLDQTRADLLAVTRLDRDRAQRDVGDAAARRRHGDRSGGRLVAQLGHPDVVLTGRGLDEVLALGVGARGRDRRAGLLEGDPGTGDGGAARGDRAGRASGVRDGRVVQVDLVGPLRDVAGGVAAGGRVVGQVVEAELLGGTGRHRGVVVETLDVAVRADRGRRVQCPRETVGGLAVRGGRVSTDVDVVPGPARGLQTRVDAAEPGDPAVVGRAVGVDHVVEVALVARRAGVGQLDRHLHDRSVGQGLVADLRLDGRVRPVLTVADHGCAIDREVGQVELVVRPVPRVGRREARTQQHLTPVKGLGAVGVVEHDVRQRALAQTTGEVVAGGVRRHGRPDLVVGQVVVLLARDDVRARAAVAVVRRVRRLAGDRVGHLDQLQVGRLVAGGADRDAGG